MHSKVATSIYLHKNRGTCWARFFVEKICTVRKDLAQISRVVQSRFYGHSFRGDLARILRCCSCYIFRT
jgi:hypothetical protein